MSTSVDNTDLQCCPYCKAPCHTLNACESCGHRFKRKRKITSNNTNNSQAGWFWGEENAVQECQPKPILLKPLTEINKKPHPVLEKANTASILPDKLDRIKDRSLYHSRSWSNRDLPPLSPRTVGSDTINKMSSSDSSPCILWGPCLEYAITEFEAKEIILHAEIDSDERCMSVLTQRLKLEDTTRSKYSLNNSSNQLRIKYSDLEKKVRINREKLTDVRARLKELRSQQESHDQQSNQTDYPEPTHSASRSRKKKKDQKLEIKRRDEAAIRIQRRFRILRARKRFYMMVKNTYQRFYDPDTKQYYYYNRKTHQSQWEIPSVLVKIHSEQQNQDVNAAACRIQSMFRRRIARTRMRKLLSQVYEKVYDRDTNAYYYYCKKTKTSTWERPKLLDDDDLKLVNVIGTQQDHNAACKIQSFYRNRASRLFILDLAMGKIDKHFDTETQAWYYYNHRTKQTFWEHAKHQELIKKKQTE